MRSIRCQLIYFLGENNIIGVSAARLKRMQAIKNKLRRLKKLKLDMIQDLGGCRVVLPTVLDVRAIGDILKDRSRHELIRENDYIKDPKKDGYRSHHLMFSFNGKVEREIFSGTQIEIQLRTVLQHSWATAVEAVGMFFGEDFKSAKTGNPEWLRFFQLMSAEFARTEGCHESTIVPPHRERVIEIIELDRKLGVINTLDNIGNVVKWINTAVAPTSPPKYYLIRYDNATDQVEVSPYFGAIDAVASYEKAERSDNVSGNYSANVVLVEADKLDNLRLAYPNYFGDVQIFKQRVRAIIGGREFKLKPQGRAPRLGRQLAISDAWMRRQKYNRPKGV